MLRNHTAGEIPAIQPRQTIFELEVATPRLIETINASRNSNMASQDFKSLQDQIQAALIAVTRTTGQISSEDLAFHRSFNPEVGTALDEQCEGLLALAGALLKSAASISDLRVPVLEDADDVDNNWRSVVDVVDSLLEKSDTCLDEYTGVIKRKDPTSNEAGGAVCYSRKTEIEDVKLILIRFLPDPRSRTTIP